MNILLKTKITKLIKGKSAQQRGILNSAFDGCNSENYGIIYQQS